MAKTEIRIPARRRRPPFSRALRWPRVRSARFFVARAIRSVKIVIQDGRIPRPLRWGAAFGLAPVPGPVDEAVLLLVGGALWLFYRDQIHEAWAAGRANPQVAKLDQRLRDEVHRHAPSLEVEGQRDMFVRDQPPVV